MTDDILTLINDLQGEVLLLQMRVTELEQKPVEEAADAFDEFWSLYPRKQGKPLARKAFAKVDAPTAIAGLESWLAVDAFATVEKYRPHASTWLNQKCYNDDPVPYGQAVAKPQIGNRTRSALDDWLNDGT